jgi:hypothetical protein
MSKLIVEMEMPKACRWYEDGMKKRCPIAEWGGACAVTKLFEPFDDNRPSWCPIKGILPDEHGDLIDRDVSIQTFRCIEEAPYSGFDGQEAFYDPEDVVNTLLCQDVVIEAEMKNDEH